MALPMHAPCCYAQDRGTPVPPAHFDRSCLVRRQVHMLAAGRVQAGRMWESGMAFFRSANGVWLTDAVAPEYIEFPDQKD